MRKTIQGAMAALFGPSRNDQLASLLQELSSLALKAAEHFRQTNAQDPAGIIAFENKADVIVGQVHELLDNSFIMRFDIPDAMRLTDELDDVIDGMRKVVLHIDSYKIYLSRIRPEAVELMKVAGDMLVEIDKLVAMLAEPKLSLARVRAIADIVDKMEGTADKLTSNSERMLVEEFSKPGSNALEFIAWHQLFHLLERMTDDANHCATQVLSLARKEA